MVLAEEPRRRQKWSGRGRGPPASSPTERGSPPAVVLVLPAAAAALELQEAGAEEPRPVEEAALTAKALHKA